MLVLSVVSIDESAPDAVQMAVSASGAGAVFGASGEDSFTFGPALPFGLSVGTKSADEGGGEETRQGPTRMRFQAHSRSPAAVVPPPSS